MSLKIKIGKRMFIVPIQCWGKVRKIRQDDAGVDLVDLDLDDGDYFMARRHELSKTEMTLDEYRK